MSTHTCGTGRYCEPCYQRDYNALRQRVAGSGSMVDAGPVREHLRHLTAHLGRQQVSSITGVHVTTLEAIAGRRTDRVRAANARAILSARVTDGITHVGIGRRLRALRALGWTLGDIAATAGLSSEQILNLSTKPPRYILGPTRDAIVGAYRRLSCERPPSAGGRDGVAQARRRAAAAGWAPPAAWDNIDDPDETPRGLRAAAAEPTTAELLDEFEHLVAGGETYERAAARIGRALGSVRGMAKAEGRRALYSAVSAAYDRQRAVAA